MYLCMRRRNGLSRRRLLSPAPHIFGAQFNAFILGFLLLMCYLAGTKVLRQRPLGSGQHERFRAARRDAVQFVEPCAAGFRNVVLGGALDVAMRTRPASARSLSGRCG